MLPANLHYRVTERFIFSGSDDGADVSLGILTPKTGPYQNVSEIKIQWEGARKIEHFETVDAIRLSGTNENEKNLEATIEYAVKLRQGKVTWDAPVELFQTLPQEGIESEHSVIQERASDLSNHIIQNLPFRIFSFTSDYLTYEEMKEDCVSASALLSYEIGSCVCAGFARLMVALSRAADIPAQVVVGFIYPDPIVKRGEIGNHKNPGEAHAWVEFRSFGKWSLADPTLGSGIGKAVQFGRNDGRHIVYGELEQISVIKDKQEAWALNNSTFFVHKCDCFRFVASSTSKKISMTPITSVQKGWDGRWANALIVWAIAVIILCKFRDKIIPSNTTCQLFG